MPRTKLSDITKDGKTGLSNKEPDFKSPRARERFRRAGVEIEKSRARKNVNWQKLNAFVMR